MGPRRDSPAAVSVIGAHCAGARQEEAERKARLKKKHKQRRRLHSQLSRRTSRGQPLMGDQIKHLLRKIQRDS